MNKSAYLPGSLVKLKDKLIRQLKDKEVKQPKSRSTYEPRKVPQYAHL